MRTGSISPMACHEHQPTTENPKSHPTHETDSSKEVLRDLRAASCRRGERSSVFLYHVHAAAERRLAARAKVLDQLGRRFRLQALVPGVVDHDHVRAVARTETFDF